MSKSNNLDMFALEADLGPVREQMYYISRSKFVRCSYFLEVAAKEYTIDSSNQRTSKHPHMSNRIYDTVRFRIQGIFLNMQSFVGTQKNRLNETLVFVYSNAYFL